MWVILPQFLPRPKYVFMKEPGDDGPFCLQLSQFEEVCVSGSSRELCRCWNSTGCLTPPDSA